jgi:hypothetical protein
MTAFGYFLLTGVGFIVAAAVAAVIDNLIP